jgi:hypothetical protein
MPTDVASVERINARAPGAPECFSDDVGPIGQCVRRDRVRLGFFYFIALAAWHTL